MVISRSIEGFRGETFFMLVTDSVTLERTTYPLEIKGTAKTRLVEHLNLVKTQTGRKAKTLRIDNGTEFGGKELIAEYVRRGIVVKFTTPYNLSQNGRAEVSNDVVIVIARKLILAGYLPKTIWLEAVVAACYLLNRLLSRRLDRKSPLKIKYSRKQHVGHLRVYSYKAYVLRHDIVRRDKFTDRTITGRLIGYEGDNIYRVWIPG
jgi:transposase InsO family protein